MPKPRKAQVSLDATPYYHCIGRCVRRAFLCGDDPTGGKNYDHRRAWIRDRLFELTRCFAVDVAAYAVMSNHYHLVIHIDREAAGAWSMREVIERWHGLFAGTPLSQDYLRGRTLIDAERNIVEKDAEIWRERLMNISWFMKSLNEWIAKRANQEDRCTGHFWEGRFVSHALLDEKALAACMVYDDLNPIRSGMAETLETSDYTSIQERIQAAVHAESPNAIEEQPARLMPFAGNPRKEMPKGLPFKLTDYLELVEWSGRIIREDKRGAIDNELPPILQRLGIDLKQWAVMTTGFEKSFKSLVGAPEELTTACKHLHYRRRPGLSSCKTLLN